MTQAISTITLESLDGFAQKADVDALATEIGTKIGELQDLLNDKAADLSALSSFFETTERDDVVSALNALAAQTIESALGTFPGSTITDNVDTKTALQELETAVELRPANPLVPKGGWDAATNAPALTDGTGDIGDYYRVTTAGTTTLNGVSEWAVGDALFRGSDNAWHKQDNTDAGPQAVPDYPNAASVRLAYLSNFSSISINGFIYKKNTSTPADDGVLHVHDAAGVAFSMVHNGVANIYWWGATGNGTTVDSPAITAAITACEADSSIGALYFPPGNFLIDVEHVITTGLKLLGAGWGSDSAGSSDPDTPQTRWVTNTADITMLRLQSATTGNVIWGGQVRGIFFDGNNFAGRLMWVRSGNHCVFDVAGQKCRNVAFQIDDGNGAIAQNNHIENMFYSGGNNTNAENGHGLVLRETNGLGTTRTTCNRLSCFPGKNGDVLQFGDHDAGQFLYVGGKPNDGGTGTGIRFGNTTTPYTQREVSRKNNIVFCNSPIVAEDQSRNTILMINSEPSGITVNGTPTLYNKTIDRNTGEVWETPTSAYRDDFTIPLPGNYTPWSGSTGTPVDATASGQQIPVTQLPAAVDTEISLRVPIPARWDEGDIVGVSIGFVRNGGGNYRMEMDGRRLFDGLGLGGTPDTESFTISDGGDSNKFGEETATFTTGFEISSGSKYLICRLCRKGTDPLDTNSNNMEIAHVELHYVGDGPHSDPINFDVASETVSG